MLAHNVNEKFVAYFGNLRSITGDKTMVDQEKKRDLE